MITIENLHVSFGKHQVLDKLNAQIKTGTITGVVGLNGAGKTTLFNTIAGVVSRQDGKILLNGEALTWKQIGYLESSNYFYSMITGNEYLKIFEQSNPRFNLEALQQYTHLPLNERIETYSTGMKKKLALLGVLKQDKPVYLFDEPFNGLDLESNKVLELIIESLRAHGKTVLLSSHILEPLLVLCDQILFLEKGSISQVYFREQFGRIEQELFGKFREAAAPLIRGAV